MPPSPALGLLINSSRSPLPPSSRSIPIHGHDVWLHLLLAAVAAYFGFVAHALAGEQIDVTGRDARTI